LSKIGKLAEDKNLLKIFQLFLPKEKIFLQLNDVALYLEKYYEYY